MDKVNTFTSTGSKILGHLDVLGKVSAMGLATPISLQVAPTSRCNLNCSFCSNVNRNKHEDLDPENLAKFLLDMYQLGLKTVEWTGGGDPTMYEFINEMIMYAKGLGLEQGFITNGVALKEKLTQSSLDSLSWVRVSMNAVDYAKESFELPEIKGVLGFSYVVNDDMTQQSMVDMDAYVKRYNPAYVRMVPNCQTTYDQQMINNATLPAMVAKLGSPYFYQAKTFDTPQRCWWGYFKPFLLHDGFIYPCSSVVLNEEADRQFHDKYRWVHMSDAPEVLYAQEMSNVSSDDCSHCVFASQNNLIDSIIHPGDMGNFI